MGLVATSVEEESEEVDGKASCEAVEVDLVQHEEYSGQRGMTLAIMAFINVFHSLDFITKDFSFGSNMVVSFVFHASGTLGSHSHLSLSSL